MNRKLYTFLSLFLLMLISSTGTAKAENLLVREDRIWNYEQATDYWNDPYEVIQRSGYHFKDVRTFDGVDYNVFRDGDDKEVAYLREEDGKVFLYVGTDQQNCHVNLVEGNECLIYDFNAHEGEIIKCAGFDNSFGSMGMMFDVEVKEVSEIEYNDRTFACQNMYILADFLQEDYSKFSVVEGVGSLVGLLPFPQFGIMKNGGASLSTYNYLRSMTTTDGEVLFRSDYGMRPEFDKRFNPKDEFEYSSVLLMDESEGECCRVKTYTLFTTGKVERNGKNYWELQWSGKHEEMDPHEYFLFREDYGSCYTYIEYPRDPQVNPDDVQPGEYLVYDFNMEEGDSFDGPVYLMDYVFYGLEPKSMALFHFEVKKKSVDESGRRVLELSCKSIDGKYAGEETVQVVEGVGFIQKGTVASLILPRQTTTYKEGPYIMFDQMLDYKGETVYLNPNEVAAGFVKERDYTWLYGIYDSNMNVSYVKYRFNYLNTFGPSTDDAQNIYRCFGAFATSSSIDGKWEQTKQSNCWQVRERDGKVWLLHSDAQNHHDPSGAVADESLIYNFKAKNNTSLNIWTPDGFQEFNIRTSFTEVGGERTRCYSFVDSNHVKCVEGIGVVQGGILPCVNGRFKLPVDAEDDSYCGAVLLAVYDGEGNLIFSQEMPSGIGEITPDSTGWVAPADRLYDLQGRELSEPQPGQPYIRAGKIHIAK